MASPDETRRIAAHLDSCPACRQTRAWMQATRQVIAARPFAEPPFDMRARIARAIAESNPDTIPVSARPAALRRPLVLRPAFTAVLTLAMVGVIGIGVYQSMETLPSPVPVAAVHPKPPRIASNLPPVKSTVKTADKSTRKVAPEKIVPPVLTARIDRSPLEKAETGVVVPPPTRRRIDMEKIVAPSVKPGIFSGVKTALKGNNKANLTTPAPLTPVAPTEKMASNPRPSVPDTNPTPVEPTPAPDTTSSPEPVSQPPVTVAQRDLSSEIRVRLTAQQGSRPAARTVAAAYQPPLRSAGFSSSELDSGNRNPGSGTADIVHTPGF